MRLQKEGALPLSLSAFSRLCLGLDALPPGLPATAFSSFQLCSNTFFPGEGSSDFTGPSFYPFVLMVLLLFFVLLPPKSVSSSLMAKTTPAPKLRIPAPSTRAATQRALDTEDTHMDLWPTAEHPEVLYREKEAELLHCDTRKVEHFRHVRLKPSRSVCTSLGHAGTLLRVIHKKTRMTQLLW